MPFFDRSGVAFALVLAGASLPTTVSVSPPVQIPTPPEEILHTTPMDVIHDKPYVMVMVNGKGPFRFVIDTGTGGQALVTPALADALSLPTTGHTRLNDPSGQGGKNAPMVLMDSLEVAGVQFRKVKAVRHVVNGQDGVCDGVLGFTLFRDYLLTLDYPHRKMTLAMGALTPDGENAVVPFRMPDGVPIAAMQIGKLRIEALVDSGGDGLSLPETLASQLKFAVDPVAFAALLKQVIGCQLLRA